MGRIGVEVDNSKGDNGDKGIVPMPGEKGKQKQSHDPENGVTSNSRDGKKPPPQVKPGKKLLTNANLSNISKSQNSSSSIKLIPCPEGQIGRNGLRLQDAMGLSDNQERYDRIQNIARHVISRRMDLRRTFRGHTEEEIALTLRALSTEIPFLSRFEKHWASRAIVKATLGNNSLRLRKLYKIERAASRMDAEGIKEADRDEAGGDVPIETYLSEDDKSRKRGRAEADGELEPEESESEDENKKQQTRKTQASKPVKPIPKSQIANKMNNAVSKPHTSTYGIKILVDLSLDKTRGNATHVENKDTLNLKNTDDSNNTDNDNADDSDADADNEDENAPNANDATNNEDENAPNEIENTRKQQNTREPKLITQYFQTIAKKPPVPATTKKELNVYKVCKARKAKLNGVPLTCISQSQLPLKPSPSSGPRPPLKQASKSGPAAGSAAKPIRSIQNTISYAGKDIDSDAKDSSFDPGAESESASDSDLAELIPAKRRKVGTAMPGKMSPADGFKVPKFDDEDLDLSDSLDSPLQRKELERSRTSQKAIAKIDFLLCPLIEQNRDVDDVVNNGMHEDWYNAAMSIKWDQIPTRVFKLGSKLKFLISSHKSLRNYWVFKKIEKTYSSNLRRLAKNALEFSDFCNANTKPGYYGQLGYDIILDCLTTMFPPDKMDPNIITPFTGHQIILLVLLPATVIVLMAQDLQDLGYDEEGLRVLLQSSARWGELIQTITEEDEAEPNSEVNRIRRNLQKQLHSLLDNNEKNVLHAPPLRMKRKALTQINADTKSLSSLQKYMPDLIKPLHVQIPALSKTSLTLNDFHGKLPAGVTPSPRKNKRKAGNNPDDLENIPSNVLDLPNPVEISKAPAGPKRKKPRLADKTGSMPPMPTRNGRPVRKSSDEKSYLTSSVLMSWTKNRMVVQMLILSNKATTSTILPLSGPLIHVLGAKIFMKDSELSLHVEETRQGLGGSTFVGPLVVVLAVFMVSKASKPIVAMVPIGHGQMNTCFTIAQLTKTFGSQGE
ncbi:hypothetical protein D9757_015108 [Collybiopsis confluens]|uniref:Uncharacterized protein n=1 Tax=Collybiopsis confluens TaxID=2823264 RepID=A0A8H5CC96_9AGAR|nr:hypothetical protein D9757_015108 [Collybiopsis confluens]